MAKKTSPPGLIAGPRKSLPHGPTDLDHRAWWGVVKRVFTESREDNLTDWAAALTYYSVLSIFPALLVIVSLIGLAGKSATHTLVTNIGALAPGSVKQTLTSTISGLQDARSLSGVLAIVGLAAALWSASGYIGAFMRASNAIYDIPEGRPIWKKLPLRVGITILTLVLLTSSVIGVVLTGGVAESAGKIIGVGGMAVTIWGIAKWPVLLVLVSGMFGVLYWVSPNARRGFRWVTAGSGFAVVAWLIASGAFALYVSNFGSYNKTYGTLAGVIIFLIWLWISNTVILLGAELNAEIERYRNIAAGHSATEEPFVVLRDDSAANEPKS